MNSPTENTDPVLAGWRAPPRPSRVTLDGRYCRIEPIDASRHGAALYQAYAADTVGALRTWLSYGPALQRTAAATEAMYLPMRHAFELGYRRYEWKCNARNLPARRGGGSLVNRTARGPTCRPSRALVASLLTLALASMQAGAATLLVVRPSAGALDLVDPGSGLRLATVEVGAGPRDVMVAPGGRTAVVSNEGTAARPGASLSVVDLVQPGELARIALAGAPGVVAFAPDGDRAYATAAGSLEVVAFDPVTGAELARRRVEEFTPPEAAGVRPAQSMAPGGSMAPRLVVASDGDSVFVAAPRADRVLQLDARLLVLLRQVEIEGDAAGLGATDALPKAECHACAAPSADGGP